MGPQPLVLPHTGRAYVDAQIIIYSVEHHPIYAPALQPLWTEVQTGSLTVVTSALTLLESLVIPLRNNDAALVRRYELFLQQRGLSLVDVTTDVLRRSAEARARTASLRTPDAIHIATSQLEHCSAFVTNDARLTTVPGLPVLLLRDAMRNP